MPLHLCQEWADVGEGLVPVLEMWQLLNCITFQICFVLVGTLDVYRFLGTQCLIL